MPTHQNGHLPGGIGLATPVPRELAASTPQVASPVAPAPAPAAAPAPAPAAVPAPAASPAAKPTGGIPSFEDNPLGAIGLILQEVAAGMRGTEGPVAKANKLGIQQQALKLRRDAQVFDAVKIGAGLIEGKAAAEATVVIDGLRKKFPEAAEVLDGMVKAGEEKSKRVMEAVSNDPELQIAFSALSGLGGVDFAVETLGDAIAKNVTEDLTRDSKAKTTEATTRARKEVETEFAPALADARRPTLKRIQDEARARVLGSGKIDKPIKAADGFWRYPGTGKKVFDVEKAENQGSRRFQNLGAYVDKETGRFLGEAEFDTTTKARTITVDGKEQSIPDNAIPITESKLHLNAMTGQQFFDLTTEVEAADRSLKQLSQFMSDAKDTRQGWQLIADQFLGHMNTIFGNKLSDDQFKAFASTGRLQGLLGAFRKEVVGGGVMTEQDALRVISRLGGDFDLTRNREVAAVLIREIMGVKLSQYELLRKHYNAQLNTTNRGAFEPKEPIEFDESLFNVGPSTEPLPPPGAVLDQ